MKTISILGAVAAAMLLTAGARAAPTDTLDGWTTIGSGVWTMDNGEILGTGKTGVSFLATKAVYTDFNIKIDMQVSNPGNSGVFSRCSSMTAPSQSICYEVNIFDARPDQSGRTGAVTEIAPPLVKIDAQDGKWHTFDITVQGDHIVVKLDGQTTVDVHDSKHATPSPLAVQLGAGTVRLKNVQITPL